MEILAQKDNINNHHCYQYKKQEIEKLVKERKYNEIKPDDASITIENGGQGKILRFRDPKYEKFLLKCFMNNEDFYRESIVLKKIKELKQNEFNDKDVNKGKNFIVEYYGVHKYIRLKNLIIIENLAKKYDYMELLEIVDKMNGFNEINSLRVFLNILIAVKFLHFNNIYHGDLKMENIMINSHRKVKLIDFGASGITKSKDELVNINLGSVQVTSPEAYSLKKINPFKNDMWSLGSLLFSMHTMMFPYSCRDIKSDWQYKRIKDGNQFFPDSFSENIKLLVKKLMHFNPNKRISIDGAISMTKSFIREIKCLNDSNIPA